MSDPQPSLEWKKTGNWGTEPTWNIHPSLEMVAKTAKNALKCHFCEVKFLTQGAFNRLYHVWCQKHDLLMRVSLPAYPRYKTLGEVSTMAFVAAHADTVPIPSVVCYDASSDDELGFEWILMDLMEGESLDKRWGLLDLNVKESLVRQICRFCAQLFQRRFSLIGSLYASGQQQQERRQMSTVEQSYDFEVDRIVDMDFFQGVRIRFDDVPRGPFTSSQEWLSARLTIVEKGNVPANRNMADTSDIHRSERALAISDRLRRLMPKLFNKTDMTVLFHNDLSLENILVTKEGLLTAIVDWEFAPVVPLWEACQIPKFLQGRERPTVPMGDNYPPSDNGTKWNLHVLEHELTLLREEFLGHMAEIEPAWLEVFSISQEKVDFGLAVRYCDNAFCQDIIENWLENMEAGGHYWSLQDWTRLETMSKGPIDLHVVTDVFVSKNRGWSDIL